MNISLLKIFIRGTHVLTKKNGKQIDRWNVSAYTYALSNSVPKNQRIKKLAVTQALHVVSFWKCGWMECVIFTTHLAKLCVQHWRMKKNRKLRYVKCYARLARNTLAVLSLPVHRRFPLMVFTSWFQRGKIDKKSKQLVCKGHIGYLCYAMQKLFTTSHTHSLIFLGMRCWIIMFDWNVISIVWCEHTNAFDLSYTFIRI